MIDRSPTGDELAAIDRLVVYGTLRSGTGWRRRLGVDHLVRSVGTCTLRGSLYDLGWYPGFVRDGDDSVVGEVLGLLDPDALAVFDRFEGIGVEGRTDEDYRREVVELAVAGVDEVSRPAWLYVFTGPVRDEQRVTGGDWLAHLATKPSEHS